ncbi:MAG: permease-like cell division protein FtsX [Eubacteriales bacterium]|nr:permease-like cell division protein FtsX [Eubacteriales bacterium]
MKIRTVRKIITEGLQNTYRNKLMTAASIGTVAAALVIFGIFWLLIQNFNYNLDIIRQQPEMVIYCNPELEETKVRQIENSIKNNEKIEEYTRVSKKEAFDKVGEILGDKKNLLEGMDESFLPVSFVLKLRDPSESGPVAAEYEKVAGIEKVDYAKGLIDFITKLTNWIRIISTVLLIILLGVSVFIISNTIKLTVYARRKEIGIMQYIGATDWYIRWPFIIEGALIGLIGAIISFLLVSYGYTAVVTKFNTDLDQISTGFNNFLSLIEMRSISARILSGYIITGIIVGAAGSFLSIRKHLYV